MPKYRFDEIAINSTEKKKPTDEDRETYIGLEHLDSGSLYVKRWGSSVPIKGEKLVMRKGDVLLGKRNAYLRRAAIAPHDGIFSAHGMVLRPKEDVIDRDFFPLFIASDYFFDTAVRISVGSLSPTVNWKDLKVTEFELPSLEEQRKLAKALWAVIRTIEAYKDLIEKTDELVKSQFIEMFGEPELNPKEWAIIKLKDLIVHANNGITRRGNDPDGDIVLRIVELQDGFIDYSNINRISLNEKEKKCLLKNGDILFVRVNGNPDYVARSAIFAEITEPVYHNDHIIRIHIDESKADVVFVREYVSFGYGKKQLKSNIKTSAGQYSISQDGIGEIYIYLPPLSLQKQYADFIRQTDKSKFAVHLTGSNLNLSRCSGIQIPIRNNGQ